MSPDERSDTATLSDLVAACLRVMDYVQGASRSDLDQDDRLRSACCYQIAVIGEGVKRISPTTRSKHPEVPWRDIAGMRDRLIHGYDSVDIDELWKTATEDVPALLDQVRMILAAGFGQVSNFRDALSPLIEPMVAHCFQSDPFELLARVHHRRPVWTRLELAKGAQGNFWM